MSDRIIGAATEPARWAVWTYRLTHRLWEHRRRFSALFLCRVARVVTGVEIHPAAVVGARFKIGHGQGVVIGNCAVIGDDCSVLHGVTLGARDDLDQMPRLGNRVQVGANAVLLGPTTLGDDAKIGAGAVVLCDVPAGWTAVGNPASLLPPKKQRERAAD